MAYHVLPDLVIHDDDIVVTYIHASGPGGQNVNKVATAAQIRFDAARCATLTSRLRARLRLLAGSRMTRDGVVILTAQRFRSQSRNREDAIERLLDLLRQAAHVPTRRIATRPSRTQRRRRMDDKSRRARIKQGRGRPTAE
ncbi:alternative ribosome rescue aminoacyl-tRNA hydrolase ArfB [Novacetimonas pomaceti]|uniref:Aminoacyl-tRNA hydrolase n=1 Tax=Novacetimonas pomaceti TaxID=2021998 RepID=A0ABX5P6Q4_9PROT|nr:alternative ribosome rescue aminoacyl-tRNA hydrolase ArfB [Novacetimonas pomaceti]PYD49116.1 aminoacyl-tRNA hydrolase [Novacetimonas pomaceti]